MSRAAIRIRRATLADVEEILALEEHFPGDRMSRRSLRAMLKARSVLVWVAEAPGSAILGALVMLTRRNSRCGRIYSVVVSPAARGQGLGARLVRHAERAARRLGCRAMALEVRADNAAARAMYHGLGYTEQAELAEYYEDRGHGLRLRRPLVPG